MLKEANKKTKAYNNMELLSQNLALKNILCGEIHS